MITEKREVIEAKPSLYKIRARIHSDAGDLFSLFGATEIDDLGNLSLILDRVSHGGHFPIGALRDDIPSLGETLHTTTGDFSDQGRRWLTQIAKLGEVKELQTDEFREQVYQAAMNDVNTPEVSLPIEAAFHKMMKGFWPEANKILLKSAGTLAVDDACGLACRQVADENEQSASKMKGFGFKNGFHGRTGSWVGVTDNLKVEHKLTNRTLPPVEAPFIEFDSEGRYDKKQAKLKLDASMENVEKYLKRNDVAFIIVEYPFQAEGGARVLHPDTMKRLRDLCKKYGKILIADCVQMGGRSWHVNEQGIPTPFPKEVLKNADIVTFGKVFRANGLMAIDFTKSGFKQNAYETHQSDFGGTYTARAVEMLMGYTIMQAILDNKLWQNAINLTAGAYNRLLTLSREFSGLIKSINHTNEATYLGWEFASPIISNIFRTAMLQECNTIVLPARETAVRWAPLVNNTFKELDDFIANVRKALQIVASQLTVS